MAEKKQAWSAKTKTEKFVEITSCWLCAACILVILSLVCIAAMPQGTTIHWWGIPELGGLSVPVVLSYLWVWLFEK